MSGKLTYVAGDATELSGKGNKILVHCCNDQGFWGAGFTAALDKKWPHVGSTYRAWVKDCFANGEQDTDLLGRVQYVDINRLESRYDKLVVANLVGQHHVGHDQNGKPPIRYSAIRKGLKEVSNIAWYDCASVVMPKMGAGLAGGDWAIIENIIIEELTGAIDVTVYVLDVTYQFNKRDKMRQGI